MKLLFAALGLAAIAGLIRADEMGDAGKLLGKWEVTKSSGDTPVGALVTFEKGGKMSASVTLDDKGVKLEGSYTFDGKKLAVKLMLGEEKIEHEFTVKFKGDGELELADGDKTDTLKKK